MLKITIISLYYTGIPDAWKGDNMKARIVPAGSKWNNFHTHTYRCRHAEGDIEDFAKRAAELNMDIIGFSEHAYLPGDENPFHLSLSEVPEYTEACRAADGQYGGVKVLCGVECDYDPSDEAFFREFYLDKMGMDYLVGSVHELKDGRDILDCFSNRHFGLEELKIYTGLYIKLIESRLFTFCAHPDLFGRPIDIGADPSGWDANAESAAKEIIEAAAANSSVLEINVSGAWKTATKGYPAIIYPRREFWEIASDYDIPVILNTDAHSLERLDAFADYGMDLIREYGLRRVELGCDRL